MSHEYLKDYAVGMESVEICLFFPCLFKCGWVYRLGIDNVFFMADSDLLVIKETDNQHLDPRNICSNI